MFNMNIPPSPAPVENNLPKHFASIIFARASGLRLAQAREMIQNNFPNEVNVFHYGRFLAEYFRGKNAI